MQSVLVVGAGFMGTGIAQVCAQAGHRVHLMDINQAALDKAINTIQRSLSKLAAKGMLKDSPEAILELITTTKDLSSATTANWVLEAALEIEDLKRELFQELDKLALATTPLATNTSTIPITHLAQATRHPERVLGLHFFGPVG
ncbi:MAG: 3-hydroxybutyryl-CoA dehydrogenase, partial [Chloroflexi bacterium]|nr:3-hydroxybutyryl-CoA dehydrogenase [Chloroflexota bacterium]